MALNSAKTKAMLVCSNRKAKKLDNRRESLNINLDGKTIETVKCAKLLGIHLDSNLTWNEHVEQTTKKINKRLGLLKRSKSFLTPKARIMFYNAVIQPVMDYGSCVWGDVSASHNNTMVKLQKRAARIITNSAWDTPSGPLFDALGIVPFPERVARAKATLMFKTLNNLVPGYLAQKFTRFNNIHDINTRNADHNLLLPRAKQNYGKRTFKFSGAKLWNELPKNLKETLNFQSFKNKLKSSSLVSVVY